MPITDGAQALPWREVGRHRFASRACVLLHIHSFQAVDDVLASAAAGLLLPVSKLKCFQTVSIAFPPTSAPALARDDSTSNQSFPALCSLGFSIWGVTFAKAVLPAWALVVAPHHSSSSPSLLPSSEEVNYGIPKPGEDEEDSSGKQTAASKAGPQGIWDLKGLCWRSHLCTESLTSSLLSGLQGIRVLKPARSSRARDISMWNETFAPSEWVKPFRQAG